MFSNQSQLLSYLTYSLQKSQLTGFRTLLVLADTVTKQAESVCNAFKSSIPPQITPSNSDKWQTVTPLTDTIMHAPDHHSNSDIGDEINNILGSENSCVVFDAKCGFDERLLAASAGTVVAGGLFVLLAPPLNTWREESLFLHRFVGCLFRHQSHRIDFSAADSLNQVALFVGPSAADAADSKANQTVATDHAPGWAAEQAGLLNKLLHYVDNATRVSSARKVVVVQADRGRGKSALIGRALRLLTANASAQTQISLCATRRSACQVLLKHAVEEGNEKRFQFLGVQQALKQKHALLVVEEAGNIPIAILEKLQALSDIIIFATTVQGYEGAGRGFAIRFAKQLNKTAPDRLTLTPTQPVRWAPGDPVEAFINQAFLLSESASLPQLQHKLIVKKAETLQVSKQELHDNEQLLSEIYGLLIQAHYQTTPADLRHILDKDSLQVYAQRIEGQLTGAALVALEGQIPNHLHAPIVLKQRRLNDQIIPQVLAQSSGIGTGLNARYARVVRIAIHPNLQRQGLGTQLFNALTQQISPELDCVGASFGADEASVSFWLKLGLTPIHYGYKANARSGLRSACLLLNTSSRLHHVVTQAQYFFALNANALNENGANDDTVLAMLASVANAHSKPIENGLMQPPLNAYSTGNRSFIDTAGLMLEFEPWAKHPSLLKLVRESLVDYTELTPKKRRLREAAIREQIAIVME